MGKENSIRTGTNIHSSFFNRGMGYTQQTTQYQKTGQVYGIVTYVNPNDKSIRYSVIKDNVVSNKFGFAYPLYPNDIQVPDVGYVIPLTKAPSTDMSPQAGGYSEITYYLDPIGIHNTVNNNKIRDENFGEGQLEPGSNSSTDYTLQVDQQSIKTNNIGFSVNSPNADNNPPPDGIYEMFWNPMPFQYFQGKYMLNKYVANHESHIHFSFTKAEKALQVINLAQKWEMSVRENPFAERLEPWEHSGTDPKVGSFHNYAFTDQTNVNTSTGVIYGSAKITGNENTTDLIFSKEPRFYYGGNYQGGESTQFDKDKPFYIRGLEYIRGSKYSPLGMALDLVPVYVTGGWMNTNRSDENELFDKMEQFYYLIAGKYYDPNKSKVIKNYPGYRPQNWELIYGKSY